MKKLNMYESSEFWYFIKCIPDFMNLGIEDLFVLSLKVNFYEYATKQKLHFPVNYNRISCLQLCVKNLTDFAAGSISESW